VIGAFERINVQADLASIRELDGVVDEVGQYLTEASRSPTNCWGTAGATWIRNSSPYRAPSGRGADRRRKPKQLSFSLPHRTQSPPVIGTLNSRFILLGEPLRHPKT
jgi:hypothetical protein